MPKVLQLQEAKAKFSEVVEAAKDGQPQIITKHGEKTAVVISYTEFERMTSRKQNLVEFLLSSPLAKSEIDLTREDSLPRDDVKL